MDPREEAVKRVTNALSDLRQELQNAGVPEDELWNPTVVTAVTADRVSVSLMFGPPTEAEQPPRRKPKGE